MTITAEEMEPRNKGGVNFTSFSPTEGGVASVCLNEGKGGGASVCQSQ